MPISKSESLTDKLLSVYSPADAKWLSEQLTEVSQSFRNREKPTDSKDLSPTSLNQSDVALITYANSIEDKSGSTTPLSTLSKFIKKYQLDKALSIVHLLPFYPWDTDRGFSVKDYYQVDPDNGTWQDIAQLSESVKLMFDFVANHASIKNPLIQNSLIERHLDHKDYRYSKYAPFQDFVITFSDDDKPTAAQLKKLTRPRSAPVLTRYTVLEKSNGSLSAILGDTKTSDKLIGSGWVWTTFSRPLNDDGTEGTRQVDLNFANPKVLLEVVRILLFYIMRGADLIRLDAIGYIWKNLNGTSLHEPQAHAITKVLTEILESAAPGVVTIAELNEPQEQVLSYLGSADDPEANMVYQFSHFPLAVHAVLTGTTKFYQQWLPTTNQFNGRQFTTVLGSHDGLPLKPVHGLLPQAEIDKFASILTKQHHALPNYASLSGGKKIIYEIAATPWNLINSPNSQEDIDLQIKRFRVVLALGLMIRGIPGIYLNGLIGSANYRPSKGLDENRTINREIFDMSWLIKQLDDPQNRLRRVLDSTIHLINTRAQEPAFAPDAGPLEVIDCNNDTVLAVRIPAPKTADNIIAITSVSDQKQTTTIQETPSTVHDILSDTSFAANKKQLKITLEPYQVLWLKQS